MLRHSFDGAAQGPSRRVSVLTVNPLPAEHRPERLHLTSVASTRWTSVLHVLGRHQLGAIVATAVDFSVMIALVQTLHARPVLGTVAGALAGAITNFLLGRHWIFDHPAPQTDKAHHQAVRYACVSAASLGLNALGVRLLAELAGVQYVVARTIVAAGVSLLWNFPMHRRYVFPSLASVDPVASRSSSAP